ncbi:HD domain-containing protein [Candidatus Peregrinibacteria bacterium]|nr:HD domain-containing protein [Candidatus Peregrinibacteria bacterium]
MDTKHLINLLFELGQLRRIQHDGWRNANVEKPESVAEHSLRAAQIGYFLAKNEKYDNPYEVVTMIVFHDIGECRIGDINKVANRYVEADEEGAVKDLTSDLNDGGELFDMWNETENRSTEAGKIAKDADYLEQAFCAKEYMDTGHKSAEDWINNVRKKLETKSAKDLLETMVNMSSTDWWQGLKKI